MQGNTPSLNATQIQLEFPFTSGARLIETVAIRRPKVADQLAAQKAGVTDVESEIHLVANLSGLTPAEVGQIDLADYAAIQELLAGFFSRRRKSSAS
jgi:hypothetical protein